MSYVKKTCLLTFSPRNIFFFFQDDGMFQIFNMVEDCDSGQAKTSTRSEVNKKEWMAWEEIRLLKAMEQYQYGNWKDVAEVVGHRSPEGI